MTQRRIGDLLFNWRGTTGRVIGRAIQHSLFIGGRLIALLAATGRPERMQTRGIDIYGRGPLWEYLRLRSARPRAGNVGEARANAVNRAGAADDELFNNGEIYEEIERFYKRFTNNRLLGWKVF